MYSFFTDSAAVYRKTIDGTTKKTTEALVVSSVKGFLKASSMQEVAQGNGAFWKDYNFTTVGTANIKSGDRLVIRWVDYSVKSTGFKRAIKLQALVCKITKINT